MHCAGRRHGRLLVRRHCHPRYVVVVICVLAVSRRALSSSLVIVAVVVAVVSAIVVGVALCGSCCYHLRWRCRRRPRRCLTNRGHGRHGLLLVCRHCHHRVVVISGLAVSLVG